MKSSELFLVWIVGAVAGLAWGVPSVPQGFELEREAVVRAAAEVVPQKYPDADKVLIDEHVLEVYEKDGTSVVWDDEWVKVLTEKGRRESIEQKLFFNVSYGTSFVERAEIVKPDGSVLPVDTQKYTRIMTEPGQMGMNIYDPNNKIATFSLPGLEIGDVYRLVTCRVTSKARMPDTWADFSVFEYSLPIQSIKYQISAPAELPVRHKVLRAAVPGTVQYSEDTMAGGRTLHTWQVKGVAQMFPEPSMPPMYTQVQRLILSTIEDWQTVSRWYWRLCEPALAATTPEMQEMVDELVKGASDRDEKIRRIFKFVSQKIRYMGITTEETAPGYEPHPVSMTFNNRYGVCRDKAALLVAMLRLAAIPAYPVLIHAGAKIDQEAPLPFFNHAITAVDKPGGGYILMDATDENTRDLLPAYLCNRSYLVARDQGETLLVSEVYPATKNMARINTTGSLDASGSVVIESTVEFEGINDNAYRGHFARMKGDQRRKFFEGLFKSRLPGAEVVACEIEPSDLQDTEQPLKAHLTARVPDYPVRGTGFDMVSLPWLGTGLGVANFVIGQTGLKERRYTLETAMTCGVEETITLKVADGLGEAALLPREVQFERAGVEFAMSQQCAAGELRGNLRYLLKTPEFSPAEYLELKKSLAEIEAGMRGRPLFEAYESSTPDQEILNDEVVTVVEAADVWTTTRTQVKRILTYAGKKSGSEMKFNFNPVWQDVAVISATVSNLNGTVQSVAAEEMNLMDAPWVGGAPRYPAGKTLVVNLPGVEIGSVITVATRTTQSNAWGYARSVAFGGMEPVERESFQLRYPMGMEPLVSTYHFGGVNYSVITNGSEVSATWSTAGSAAVHTEELLPPWHFYKPILFVSLVNWDEHTRRLKGATKVALKGEREARRHARKLVKGIRDPRQRLLAVRDEVLRSVRPAGPSYLELPPGSFSEPDRTLADQYGNPVDRALLLLSMVRAVGFRAELLFASFDTTRYAAYGEPSLRVPQLGYFSVPVVLVKHKGREYLLNEGDQYDELGASGLDGALALNLRGKVERIELEAELHNRGKKEFEITLAEDGGAKVVVTEWFYGTSVGRFRKQYREMLPEELRRHHLEMVGAVARSAEPASALEVDLEGYPGRRSFAVTAADYCVVQAGVLTFTIPEVAGAVFPLRGDKRESPLFMGSNEESGVECRVILPKGFTAWKIVPESRRWSLPGGLGELDYSVERGSGSDGRVELLIKRRIERRAGVATPELYPALLECNRVMNHAAARTLVVGRE